MSFYRPIWPTLVVAMVIALSSCPAMAQDSGTPPTEVVLVRLQNCCALNAWPAADARIHKELALSNVEMTDLSLPAGHSAPYREALENALQSTSAEGAILVSVTPDDGVMLHSLFRTLKTETMEYNQHFLAAAPAEGAIEVVALKTREAVLAALYQQKSSIPSPEKKKESTAIPAPLAHTRQPIPVTPNSKRRLSIGALLGTSWSPGGIGPMGNIGATVSVHPSNRIAIGARGDISVLSRDIETKDASASTRLITGRLYLSYLFAGPGPMFPSMGIQLGMGHFQSHGKSDVHLVKSVDTNLFFGGLFGALSFELNRHIRIPLTLGVGALLPGIEVRLAGKPEAALNVLFLEAGIGVMVLL